ncbi:MAG: ABC transporter ATP-binding protein [Thermoanaerobaculia bacterium]
MSADSIVFENLSKFYGEILGVNRVNLTVPPGITALVGPNGSGKTTLFNLATGLLRPTHGSVRVMGVSPDDPVPLFRLVGYCTSVDSFPRGVTGLEFVTSYLTLHGLSKAAAREKAAVALARVNLTEAQDRRVAGYSKGMRQRARLAQSLAHDPKVLLLDEPLNGLDPMARAEAMEVFRQVASEGAIVIISSHILHEVDQLADRVVLLKGGYIVAAGDVHGVRDEVEDRPTQILIRCDRPSFVASRLFAEDHTIEVTIHDDRGGLVARTRDADRLYQLLSRCVIEDGLQLERVGSGDDDVQAVYRYLIESDAEVH